MLCCVCVLVGWSVSVCVCLSVCLSLIWLWLPEVIWITLPKVYSYHTMGATHHVHFAHAIQLILLGRTSMTMQVGWDRCTTRRIGHLEIMGPSNYLESLCILYMLTTCMSSYWALTNTSLGQCCGSSSLAGGSLPRKHQPGCRQWNGGITCNMTSTITPTNTWQFLHHDLDKEQHVMIFHSTRKRAYKFHNCIAMFPQATNLPYPTNFDNTNHSHWLWHTNLEDMTPSIALNLVRQLV